MIKQEHNITSSPGIYFILRYSRIGLEGRGAQRPCFCELMPKSYANRGQNLGPKKKKSKSPKNKNNQDQKLKTGG